MESSKKFLQLILTAASWFSVIQGEAFAVDKSLTERGVASLNTWWLRNIFCQFNDKQLKRAVERCAKEIDCTTFYGEPGSIDICAVGSFIKVIDRNIVGHGVWKEYIEGIDSAGGDVPCIIVDCISDLPLSKGQYVCQLDLKNPTAIQKIIQTIKQMRRALDKNVPDIFAKRVTEES